MEVNVLILWYTGNDVTHNLSLALKQDKTKESDNFDGTKSTTLPQIVYKTYKLSLKVI